MGQLHRALSRLLLVVFFSVAHGCSEYNRHPTGSEDDSLSGVTQLTRGFKRAGEASFSRDMRWMVFQAVPADGGDFQIYVAKTVTRAGDVIGIDRPIRVTPTGSRSASGCISPDGLSMIFASTAGTPDTSASAPMRLFRVDGWEGAVSLANPAAGIDLAQNPLTSQGSCTDCSFSPDGKLICYASRDGSNSSIFIMHADGSHIVRITNSAGQDGSPFFSPDGASLVFRGDREGKNLPQIFLADLAFDQTGEITGLAAERKLTHDEFVNYGPRWHPDGQHIIYSTNKDGKTDYNVYLMDRSGRHKTQLTFFTGADLFPAFSTDGSRILWTSRRSDDSTMQIFTARFVFPRGT